MTIFILCHGETEESATGASPRGLQPLAWLRQFLDMPIAHSQSGHVLGGPTLKNNNFPFP